MWYRKGLHKVKDKVRDDVVLSSVILSRNSVLVGYKCEIRVFEKKISLQKHSDVTCFRENKIK